MPKSTPTHAAAPGWVLALALSALGCGPIGATSLIADAEIAVARAHASDGDKHAIYEITSADLYLQKAKEEQGHARYGPAMELAKQSVGFAEQATLRAAQHRTGAAPPLPQATIAHPAGESAAPALRPMIAEPPRAPALVAPPPAAPPAAAPPTAASPAPAAPAAGAPAGAAPSGTAPLVKPADEAPKQRPVLIPGQPAAPAPKPPEKREKQPITPEGVQ